MKQIYRSVFLLVPAVFPLGAIQIAEYVNCGGFILNSQLSRIVDTNLRCDQNGFVAVSHYWGPGSWELVALPTVPGATGMVEAQISVQARWQLIYPKDAFWVPCLSVRSSGPGTGTATASLGPATLGVTCDLAHSVQVFANVPLIFEENATAYATGGVVFYPSVDSRFFDAFGNPISSSYAISLIAEVPEPSERWVVALATIGIFIGVRVRRLRYGH